MSLFKKFLLPACDLLSSGWFVECLMSLRFSGACETLCRVNARTLFFFFKYINMSKEDFCWWVTWFLLWTSDGDYGGVLIAWFKSIWLVFVVFANTQCQCEQILSLCKTWKTISGKELWLSSDNTLAMCADIFWRCEACTPAEDWYFETSVRWATNQETSGPWYLSSLYSVYW